MLIFCYNPGQSTVTDSIAQILNGLWVQEERALRLVSDGYKAAGYGNISMSGNILTFLRYGTFSSYMISISCQKTGKELHARLNMMTPVLWEGELNVLEQDDYTGIKNRR